MTTTLPLYLRRGGAPFSFDARRRAVTRISADRGGRARLKTGRPRIHAERAPIARPPGYAFHVSILKRARARLFRNPIVDKSKLSLAATAAQYASDNYVGILEAAEKFDAPVSLVRQAWQRLFPGVLCPHVTPSKLDRAVQFMRARDCTVRKAAAIYGLDPHVLVKAWNKATGTNRQLVGEAAPRLSSEELDRAGLRERYVLLGGGVE